MEEYVEYWERKSLMFSKNGDIEIANTLFDDQLELVYESSLHEGERLGIEFFESCGYYDSPGANTVETFLESTKLTNFWGISANSKPLDKSIDDPEEKTIQEECSLEREIVTDGVLAIQGEFSTLGSKLGGSIAPTSMRPLTPQELQGLERIMLPPFSSYLLCLKRKSHRVLSSWSKRWFYLDWVARELWYFKKGFRKSPRGCIELTAIREVRSLSTTDFEIRYGTRNMLLRAQNYEQKRVWVTLLEFGRQGSRELQSNGSESSAILLNCVKSILKSESNLEDVQAA